jgi:heterodisulfide reductase subunit A-like polyferredoxin
VKDVEFDEWGRMKIEKDTLMTTRRGLFAAGDMVTGPLSVIDASAAGKRVALAIDRYIRKDKGELPEWNAARGESEHPFDIPADIEKKQRVRPDRLGASVRVKGFEEVEQTVTSQMAVEEALRCLNCGSCSECMECVRACEILQAVDHDMYMEEIEIKAGSVVLAVDDSTAKGAEVDGTGIYSLLDIELDKAGKPLRPRLWDGSLESNRGGIYVPAISGKKKDFYGEVVTASAVSSELAGTMGTPRREIVTGKFSDGQPVAPSRLGAFVCRCGGGISDYVDVDQVAGRLGEVESVAFSGTVDYACSAEGVQEMKTRVEDEGLDAMILAACSCCSLEQICSNCSHQRVRQKEEIFGALDLPTKNVELVNIREHAAWVHAGNQKDATEKAYQIVKTGTLNLLGKNILSVNRVREVGKRVTVVGDGTVAFSCAGTLISLGFDVVLVKTDGGSDVKGAEWIREWNLIPDNIIEGAEIAGISGGIGSFSIIKSIS